MRIDAHHHVWRIARGDYGWLTPDLPIHRDYGLADLMPLLGDVTGTVLVQAAPTEAETRFMLETARASRGLVRGVVGWADLAAPDAPERIARLAEDRLLKGLRPMLQDVAETGWILRDELAPALRAMAAHGLRLDLLMQPRHLDLVPALAARHPDLPMVLDHAGKPDIAGGAFEDWARQVALIARETPVFCKMSGLVTEAGAGWDVPRLAPYTDHLLHCFGPARLLWGSDWPVVDLAGGYRRWRDASETLLAHLPGPDRDAVLGGTASRFYALDVNDVRRS
jgi:L-fuconolactonase